jgi:hypothetical protein
MISYKLLTSAPVANAVLKLASSVIVRGMRVSKLMGRKALMSTCVRSCVSCSETPFVRTSRETSGPRYCSICEIYADHSTHLPPGETCEEFQKRLQSQNFAKEEAASKKTIQKESKPCPGCKANIQRNGGCDAMRCKCGVHFCFLCLRPYSEINRNSHGPECMYSQAGRMDPHMGLGEVGAAVGGFAGFVFGFLNMGGN